MTTSQMTAEHIAQQICRGSLHEEYDGFTINGTSVRRPEVPEGHILVEGYVGDYDDDVALSFMLKVVAVNAIDYGSVAGPADPSDEVSR